MTSLDINQVKELLAEKKDKKFMWILIGAALAAAVLISVLFLLTQQISILIGWSPIPNICHSNCIYHKFLLNEKKLIKINLYKLLSLFCCVC